MRKLLQTTLLLLVIILLANGSYAQSLIMDNSTNLKEVDRPVFIGKNDSVFFVKSITTENNNDKAFVLKCFRHADMSIVYDKLILPPQINKLPTSTENVLYLNDKLYLFTSQYDSKTKQNNLYVSTINSDGTVNNDPKLIHTKSKEDKSNYLFRQSTDKSKILVAYWENKDETKFCLNSKVFDNNLQLFWEEKMETQFVKKMWGVKQLTIDNNGNIYFLYTHDEYEGKKFKNFHHSVVSYDFNKNDYNYLELDNQDNFIPSNFKFNIDSRNNIVIGGFYSDPNDSEIKTGVYSNYSRVNSGFFVASMENKSFDNFKMNFVSLDTIFKSNGFVDVEDNLSFNIRYIIINEMINDAIIVAEKVLVKPYGDRTTAYYVGNVTVASFNMETELNWVRNIEKRQMHILYENKDKGESYYTSFFPIVSKENIKIIYKHDKRSFLVNNIDNKGNISSKEVNSAHFNIENPKAIIKDKGVNLTLKNSLKISENEIVTYNPEIKKFVKLILE